MVKQKTKECIICLINKKPNTILNIYDYFLIALERPYMNLYAHKSCYKFMSESELLQLLSENMEICYNYKEKG